MIITALIRGTKLVHLSWHQAAETGHKEKRGLASRSLPSASSTPDKEKSLSYFFFLLCNYSPGGLAELLHVGKLRCTLPIALPSTLTNIISSILFIYLNSIPDIKCLDLSSTELINK